jgi:membrane-associated phospholipid phosphatase
MSYPIENRRSLAVSGVWSRQFGHRTLPLVALLICCHGGRIAGAQQILTGQSQASSSVRLLSAQWARTNAVRMFGALPNAGSATPVTTFPSALGMPEQVLPNPAFQTESPVPSGQSSSNPNGLSEPGERPISWGLLVPNMFADQKGIWLSPVRLVKGRHWKPVLGFFAATGGLVALDPTEASYFRSSSGFHTFDQVFSGTNTGIAMAAVPVGFYAAALIRHNTYDQHTSLLAGEAVLDSELLAAIMKSTIRRLRPSAVPAGAGFTDTFTDGKGGFFSGQGSFPSGHAIAAFSIATVFADRYPRHRWVPWLAYGLAATVAFSRLPLQAHFSSDVFVGAVFGYTISHYVVLQR